MLVTRESKKKGVISQEMEKFFKQTDSIFRSHRHLDHIRVFYSIFTSNLLETFVITSAMAFSFVIKIRITLNRSDKRASRKFRKIQLESDAGI